MVSSSEMHAPFEVTIRSGRVRLGGHLGIPLSPVRHGGLRPRKRQRRFSPRNNFVARHLQQGKVATLLIDLLTPDEAEDRRKVFDIDLLADRVLLAKDLARTGPSDERAWASAISAPAPAPVRPCRRLLAIPHRFGLSCHGAADRIWPKPISPSVTAPTLLIVGGNDEPVIEMNRAAYRLLSCPKRLVIVPAQRISSKSPARSKRLRSMRVLVSATSFILPHRER